MGVEYQNNISGEDTEKVFSKREMINEMNARLSRLRDENQRLRNIILEFSKSKSSIMTLIDSWDLLKTRGIVNNDIIIKNLFEGKLAEKVSDEYDNNISIVESNVSSMKDLIGDINIQIDKLEKVIAQNEYEIMRLQNEIYKI